MEAVVRGLVGYYAKQEEADLMPETTQETVKLGCLGVVELEHSFCRVNPLEEYLQEWHAIELLYRLTLESPIELQNHH
jgi:hypothetical protein